MNGFGGGLQGMSGARPIHVHAPVFAPTPMQARLHGHILGRAAGGTLDVRTALQGGGFMSGLNGLGTSTGGIRPPYRQELALSGPPPTLYGGTIAPNSPEDQEVLNRLAVAQDAKAQGATDEQAFKSAGLALDQETGRAVVAGASEGILGGIASIIGSILGPVAGAGASAYQTYEQSRIAKDANKQRQAELMILQETRRRDQEFALQQQQASGAFWNANAGSIAAGAATLAVAVGVAAWAFGGKKGGSKRGRRR